MNAEETIAHSPSPEPRSVHFSDSTLLRSGGGDQVPVVVTPDHDTSLRGVETRALLSHTTPQRARDLFIDALSQPWTTLALIILIVFVTVISIYALVVVVEHSTVMSRLHQETGDLNRRVTEMHASVAVLLQSAPRVVYRVRTPVRRALMGSFPTPPETSASKSDLDIEELTAHLSSLHLAPKTETSETRREDSAEARNDVSSEPENHISSP